MPEVRTLLLTEKQQEAWDALHDSLTTELIFGGGAGGGKSRLGCSWLIEQCGLYPGTRWLMGRVELEQLKKTTLNTFFEVVAAPPFSMKAGVDFTYNVQEKTITFAQGGSQILLYDLGWYPSDPLYDRLGSLEITGGFVDEVGQVLYRCWEIIKTRIRYKLDEYNLIPKLLGSLNPTKAWPYGEFYSPWKNGTLPPHRRFIQALVTDNPFAPKVYIQSLREMKDKAQQQRLLFGNWEYDDDPAALFPFDVIADLFTNTGTPGERYITGDVSRQGRDRMVLGLWEGWQCIKVVEIPYEIRMDTVKAEEFIREFAANHGVRMHRVILDEDGIGGGHVDHLGCYGFVNNASPIVTEWDKEEELNFGRKVNYANLKAQCYFLLAQKAAAGLVGVTCDPDTAQLIIQELEQIKRKDADKDGKVAVLSKDVIKLSLGRSPDFADMLMMRARFELPFGDVSETAEYVPHLVTGGLMSKQF